MYLESTLEKRDRILDDAAACFMQSGFVETSLDQIVVQGAAVKQTIYNHFDSKESLFKATIDRLLERNGLTLKNEWLKLQPREFFLRLGKVQLASMQDSRMTSFLRLIVKECRRFPELQLMYAQSIPKPVIDMMSTYIVQRMNTPRQSAEAMAWSFRAAITGYATISNVGPLSGENLPTKTRYLEHLSQLFAQMQMHESDRQETLGSASPPESTASADADICREIAEFLNPAAINKSGTIAKRSAILAGALLTFAFKGLADSSMDEVAEAAGVSKQTIYSHFKSKTLLYTTLCREVMIALQKNSMKSHLEGDDGLSTYCRDALAASRKLWLQEFFRLVIGESLHFPMESGALLLRLFDFGKDSLALSIKEKSPKSIDSHDERLDCMVLAIRGMVGSFVLLRQVYTIGESTYIDEHSLEAAIKGLVHARQSD